MQLQTSRLAGRPRRVATLVLAVMLLATLVAPVAAQPAAASENFPESIPLPVGFRPEGITIGYGATFWVGSIPTGDIYRGNLQTGEGGIFIDAPPGRAAIGMKVDERTRYLFVAGGPTGMGFVYNAITGRDIAQFSFDAADPRFINDVFVTNDAAYFTNSRAAELYRVPLRLGGRLVGTFETLPLTGEWVQPANTNGANGITATPGGRWLIVMNSGTQQVFRVDPQTGAATAIDVGQPLPNGDGLWLEGHTLWVVQNRLNQVAVMELNEDFTAGQVVDVITSPLFRVPTTIAPFGPWFYAVNARFGVANPDQADYDIVRFDKR